MQSSVRNNTPMSLGLKYPGTCVSLRCLKQTLETKGDQGMFTLTSYILFVQVNLKFLLRTGNQGDGLSRVKGRAALTKRTLIISA